jgi:hypothetical protein
MGEASEKMLVPFEIQRVAKPSRIVRFHSVEKTPFTIDLDSHMKENDTTTTPARKTEGFVYSSEVRRGTNGQQE